MLPISKEFGHGGTGLYDGTLKALLTEAQGLKVALVAGAASGKLNIAALRPEDTIKVALHLVGAGTAVTDVVDITSTTTISTVFASGTVTFASAVAADTVTLRGKVYTFRAAPSIKAATYEVALGTGNVTPAANLAAAINIREAGVLNAVAANDVVTITALAEGVGPNAYTLASINGTRLAVSGATLTGGTATGGIDAGVSTASGKVLVLYANKQ